MTDKNLADSKSEITIDRDPFFDLWSKAKLISVGGPLHRFVPREPGRCQVLGNKVGPARNAEIVVGTAGRRSRTGAGGAGEAPQVIGLRLRSSLGAPRRSSRETPAATATGQIRQQQARAHHHRWRAAMIDHRTASPIIGGASA